ncbi:MAG: transglycosylase SLT domain-containing protein [Chloroflexota bacterium]
MIIQSPILAARRLLPHLVLLFALVLIGVEVITMGAHLLSRPRIVILSDGSSAPQLSSIFTPEVRYWTPLIYAWSTAYQVDPNLIATVMQIESCGNPIVVSNSGAQGLFQVMPDHFDAGEDTLEVLTNGRRGMEYLAKGLRIAAGDAGLALAGYNGGHGVIKAGWARWPAETRRYYHWGVGIYDDASKGLTTSPTMQAWLQAGGSRLCQQAANTQAVALNQ